MTKADTTCALECAGHILRESEEGVPKGFKHHEFVETIEIALSQLEDARQVAMIDRVFSEITPTIGALRFRRASLSGDWNVEEERE